MSDIFKLTVIFWHMKNFQEETEDLSTHTNNGVVTMSKFHYGAICGQEFIV